MISIPLYTRRIAAIGLGVIFLFTIWNLGIKPIFRSTIEAIEKLNDVRFELYRLTLLATESKSITPAELLLQAEILQTLVFATQTDNGVIVSTIDELVQISGAQLTQLKTSEPRQTGGLIQFTVDLTASAQEQELTYLLKAIENHRPLLIIDRAVIVSQNLSTATPSLPLHIELKISGFGGNIPEIINREQWYAN